QRVVQDLRHGEARGVRPEGHLAAPGRDEVEQRRHGDDQEAEAAERYNHRRFRVHNEAECEGYLSLSGDQGRHSHAGCGHLEHADSESDLIVLRRGWPWFQPTATTRCGGSLRPAASASLEWC